MSTGNGEADEDWEGGGRVVGVNFIDAFGWLGPFVVMGCTGLLGNRAPSILQQYV